MLCNWLRLLHNGIFCIFEHVLVGRASHDAAERWGALPFVNGIKDVLDLLSLHLGTPPSSLL